MDLKHHPVVAIPFGRTSLQLHFHIKRRHCGKGHVISGLQSDDRYKPSKSSIFGLTICIVPFLPTVDDCLVVSVVSLESDWPNNSSVVIFSL